MGLGQQHGNDFCPCSAHGEYEGIKSNHGLITEKLMLAPLTHRQNLDRQLANPPERMPGRDPLLDRHAVEQGGTALLLASSQRMGNCPFWQRWPGFSDNS